MSNHMEILDAQTVTAGAKVTRWNEFEDDDEGELIGALYWRQWYNSTKKKISVRGILLLDVSSLTKLRNLEYTAYVVMRTTLTRHLLPVRTVNARSGCMMTALLVTP